MYIPRREFDDEPKIIIFSGAGLDAPSGLKTFRGSDGLWDSHKIQDICTESTWKQNFEEVHNFYNGLRNKLEKAQPNKAHLKIKELYEKYPDSVLNITMNISDFFERLEVPVLHIHGELKKMECYACGTKWDIGYKQWDIEKDRCPKCNSRKGVKPSIVFFGGQAPMYSYLWRAFEHTMNKDTIVIVIGTQGNVVNVEENLIGTPCKKILCNMEASADINVKKCGFDKVYYESIETAIDKIMDDIEEWKK